MPLIKAGLFYGVWSGSKQIFSVLFIHKWYLQLLALTYLVLSSIISLKLKFGYEPVILRVVLMIKLALLTPITFLLFMYSHGFSTIWRFLIKRTITPNYFQQKYWLLHQQSHRRRLSGKTRFNIKSEIWRQLVTFFGLSQLPLIIVPPPHLHDGFSKWLLLKVYGLFLLAMITYILWIISFKRNTILFNYPLKYCGILALYGF